ncbi:TetR/AcrR family transcriptional regulator [Parasphingopyxis sp.]
MTEQRSTAGEARKPSEDRRAELVASAADQIVAIGSTAISLNAVSEAVGASRALVYAYFSDRDALVAAVLEDHIEKLEALGLRHAARGATAVERGCATADVYLRHVIAHGPILRFILRDSHLMKRIGTQVGGFRIGIMLALAQIARRDLALLPREAMALAEMMSAIPEELGRLCRAGELDADDAQATCARLVEAGIRGLTPSRESTG